MFTNILKLLRHTCFMIFLIFGWLSQVSASTAFTYQGQLKNASGVVTSTCQMQFSLYDAATDGSQVGTTVSKTDLSVVNGLFTTQLDFGSSAFDGNARWLEIAVQCGSDSAMTTLSRQALTSVPYAIHALSVSSIGTVQITDANVTEDKLAPNLAFDDGDLLNLSAIDASATDEGLILPQAADVSAATAEGQISWD